MIPRVQVDVRHARHRPIAEVRGMMARAHTRYPVLGEREEPVGVVHLADVLAAEPDDQRRRSTARSCATALVVPTLMPLPDALEPRSRGRATSSPA